MLVAIKQIIVPPGHQLILQDISWDQFEEILENLGQTRGTRLSYSKGVLEFMTPLPEHEDDRVIIGNFVEVILEEMGIEFRNLGSTTLKNRKMRQAVEPDSCFYIENEAIIRGRKRIDLENDPPPDLAIEIDLTSRTRFDNYEQLGVRELWRFNGTKLEINLLENGQYIESQISNIFPSLSIAEMLPKYLEESKVKGRNATMKVFRNWVRENI
jgi:Uma2 family endonuclease